MIVKCLLATAVALVAISIGTLVYVRLQPEEKPSPSPPALITTAVVPLLEYKPPPRLMVISFDGFRADYLSDELTPTMAALARTAGVTGHMLSTFCTKTFPNHHSIATGLYQETHGIVHNNNHMWDAELGGRFADKEDGTFDHWWDNGLATPIYIANQMAEPSRRASCCAPWIGCHVRYLGGEHRAHYHRHFNRTDQWREQLEWALAAMTNTTRPANLVMIYIHEPDATGHLDGPYGEQTLAKVREVDQFVAYVLQRLLQSGLEPSTNLLLLSDHGIAQIDPERVIVLDTLLPNTDWYDVYGCSPVLHVQPRRGYETELARAMADLELQQAQLHMRIYTKDSIPARFHYRNHRRIHQYVLVADEGWSLHATELQAAKERDHRGQHGYDNEAQSMRPLFIATGPAFKRAHHHPTRFTNVDLYPLMCRVLDIPVGAHYHEGNITRVEGMLR